MFALLSNVFSSWVKLSTN